MTEDDGAATDGDGDGERGSYGDIMNHRTYLVSAKRFCSGQR